MRLLVRSKQTGRAKHAQGSHVGLALAFVVAIVTAIPVLAQIPGLPPAAAAPAERPADGLGRDTPRGTIAGLNLAVHREDFASAARYLELTASQRPRAETLARQLTELMDRYFAQPIMALSSSRTGVTEDGLPPDRERVELAIADKRVSILLKRVNDPQAGPIWLISSETLAQVPALYESAHATWLERVMPNALYHTTLLGVPIARWIGWAASIAIPFLGLWLLSAGIIFLDRTAIGDPKRRALFESWFFGLRSRVVLVATLAVHLALLPYLGFSLRFRFVYARFAQVAAVFAVAWLVWRFLALSFEHARSLATRRGDAGINSLLMLAHRVVNAVVILAAILALLTIAGVDTTTALAGVGLGGVAVALGAQKSVENLLGGVFLLTDQALAVGDTCTIANRVGVVEDITLRSVRLRTQEQTLLSVPAGTLSQASLENFATRNKILVLTTLRLRYGTTADQLRMVLKGIRELLVEDPDIETATSRIRLVDFGVRAIELELFAYVLTPDFQKFLTVREDLLLKIAAVVESSGTGFAQPTQFVYQEHDADVEHRMLASNSAGQK